MTIRRLLLTSFLLVSLVPAAFLTLIAFSRTRSAMLNQIEQGVHRSAVLLSADVDRLMSERLLNATTWNHLEVMQDLRVDDVDKRLSGFLAEMKRRYGETYLDMLALDRKGKVISSSTAARIGQIYATPNTWFSVDLEGGRVQVDRPRDGQLSIRSAIDSSFADEKLGDLVLELNWRQIDQTMDSVSDRGRESLVQDAEGEIVAASAGLRRRGALPGAIAPNWNVPDDVVDERDGRPWMDVDLLVGSARSVGTPTFPGFGWTTFLLQSRSDALSPVRHMAFSFAGLLMATTLVTVLASFLVAGTIARPIVALTEFTRRYLLPGPAPPVPAEGPGEIGELNRSFVGVIADLQRSQSTLTQASKLAALGEVTALLAHEVRTPLGILRSSAQMLMLESNLSAEGVELLRILESETERLNRLISSMLDSARTRLPQRQREDLHAIVKHAAALLAGFARDRLISIDLQLAARDSMTDCDAEQITQVLLNLIMNALQILPPMGRITVVTGQAEDRLIIEVGDNGPGVAPDERTKIFEPFVFKREGGLGLGLAVVRQILRQHSGDIIVEENSGGGALFRFWLPSSSAP